MLNESQLKGLTTELQCQLFFTSLGYNVSVPIAQDCRYDLVLDVNDTLYKIQVKTSRPNDSGNEGLLFNTVSSRMNHTKGNIKQKYDAKQVDFFATYFEDKVYLIPIDICRSSEKRLVKQQSRFSNQKMDLLEDYEATVVLQRILNNQKLVIDRTKTVHQYTLDGVYISSFASYMDAARSLGITSTAASTHIGEAVRGIRNSAYGYKWKRD